jgi:hypothetical protein
MTHDDNDVAIRSMPTMTDIITPPCLRDDDLSFSG